MARNISSLSGTQPLHRETFSHARLRIEELEPRIVQDAALHGRMIPDGLVDHSIVREWNAEHVALNTAAVTVQAIQSDVARFTTEQISLGNDRTELQQQASQLQKELQVLTTQLENQQKELADLEKQRDLSLAPAAPRTLALQGEQEAQGAQTKPILQNGFLLRATVKPDALRFGFIIAQYDSSTGEMIDSTFTLAMLNGGGILFCVYGDAKASLSQTQGGVTAEGVLRAGVSQVVEASFDPKTQMISLSVDGKAVALNDDYKGKVSAFQGGHTPVHVGHLLKEGGRRVGVFPGTITDATMSEQHAPVAPATPTISLEQEQYRVNGAVETPAALVTPLLQDGFVLRARVTPAAYRSGIIAAQYDNSTEVVDFTMALSMTKNGGVEFYVYQDTQKKVIQGGVTADRTLIIGKSQEVEASFDPKTQEMKVRVDGKELPLEIYASGKVTSFKGGTTPMQVGSVRAEGGGRKGVFDGQIDKVFLSSLHPPKAPAVSPETITAKQREIATLKTAIGVKTAELRTTENGIAQTSVGLTAAAQKVKDAEATLSAAKRITHDEQIKMEALDGALSLFLQSYQEVLATHSLTLPPSSASADFGRAGRAGSPDRETAPLPASAPTREGYVIARTEVTVTQSGDSLELRTKFFDGTQSFRLGSTVITPQKGDAVLTIPLFAVPEEMRGNLDAIQNVIDRQMVWNKVVASATNSRDVFKPSSLGNWTVDIGPPGDSTTRLSSQNLTPDIAGIAGLAMNPSESQRASGSWLTGIAPDGTTGKELTSAAPRIVSRPVGDDYNIQLENMPAGYTLQIERGKPWEYHQTIYKQTITPGSFSRTVENQGRFLHWTILGPSGEFIDDRVFDPSSPVAWPLPMITLPVTRDLPLMVGVNDTNAPLAIGGAGTDALPAGGLLVRPTAGKDVHLSFAPNGAGKVMLDGQLKDLDRRAGDGITVTISVRSATGTMREFWKQQVPNGETFSLGNLPRDRTCYTLAAGESVVVTVSTGADDRCDAVQADIDVAFLPASASVQTPAYPMGGIAPGLKTTLGNAIINLIGLFSAQADQLNMNSTSDAIARGMMGAAYDGLSDTGKRDMRNGIDQAKSAVWDMMIGVVQQEFDWVLLKMNGVAMPPSDARYNDGHQGIYLAQIPGIPSRQTIRNILWEKHEDVYSNVYTRISGDSASAATAATLKTQQSTLTEAALFEALRSASLITANNTAPAQRSLDQQLALDKIYTAFNGAPNRAGWTVAEVKSFEGKVAERDSRTAAVVTDGVIAGPGVVVVNEPIGPLATQSIHWEKTVGIGSAYTYSFTLAQPTVMAGQFSVGAMDEGSLILQHGGDVVAQTMAGEIDATHSGSLTQTLLPGTYTLTFVGNQNLQNQPIKALFEADLSTVNAQWITNSDALVQTKLLNELQRTLAALMKNTATGNFSALEYGKIGMITSLAAVQNSSPVYRALHAASEVDALRILSNAGILEYLPGDGSKPGKLAIIIDGHSQTLDETNDHVGMNALTEKFKFDGYEVLHFSVGSALNPITMDPEAIEQATMRMIQARLKGTGPFSGMPPVQHLSGAGYSWGGGTMARIVDTLRPAGKTTPYTIDLALVDAVQLGYGGAVMPVTTRPKANRVFNRYQEGGHSTFSQLFSGAYDALHKNIITILPEGIRFTVPYTEIFPYLKQTVYAKGEPANGGKLIGMKEGIDNENRVSQSIDPKTGDRIDADHINIDDSLTIDPLADQNSGITVIDAAFSFLAKK